MADFNFGVLTPTPRVGVDGSALARVLDSALSATGEKERWEVTGDGFWRYLTPQGQPRRTQGWKLHVSATPASAETVLARSLTVLLDGCSPFKFANTTDHVAQLNARHAPRGNSGKFITIYPHSDEEAVRLADALHQATVGLAGPYILSDRPYVPGSLVHYRYGAFVEERRISNDGLYTWVIFDPDGNPVEDRRVGNYMPPTWAPCPFPDSGGYANSGTNGGDQGVLVGGRFLAQEAIRHVNKGGVYRAIDTLTGADAIIKEARPHVAADTAGKDVRDLLRAEARALETLGPLDVAPRMLMLFEHSEHLFLAEEAVPGVPLRQWVLDKIREGGWRRYVPGAMETANRLVELMAAAHRAGIIIRDFTPTNIMVLPDGQLRLIDLELAVVSGQREEAQTGSGTPGYSAPEQMAGAPAAIEADYYSLGATLCFVVMGSTPELLDDVPRGRPLGERLAEWLGIRRTPGLPAAIRALIPALMDDEPENRATTTQAMYALAAPRNAAGQLPQFHSPLGSSSADGPERVDVRLDDEQWQQAVDGIVGYLLASINPADDDLLWPENRGSGASDPCAVQLGAAGVVRVLTRCFELTGDQRLPEVIAIAVGWIARRLRPDLTRPPGLYVGEAGIAWSLYEAGRALNDHWLVERGLALADTLPVSSPHADITHGTAGIGLTFLHLWLRTGDEEFVQRASRSADTLIEVDRADPDGLIWGTPAAFDSRLAGGRYYGFAHGTAGVGYFLLAAALATGRSDCLKLAGEAGETLLAKATVAQGVALWGAGPGDITTAPYWCHGSAGIGGFLTRLHRATGDHRFDEAAHMSAQAVMENAWRGVLGQCHGLAGNGDFLLDMAEAGDGQRYEELAHQLARVIFASRAHRPSGVVFPGELGDLSATWAGGVSGILAFLLRLRYRSSRLWMVDSLLKQSHAS
ncbi:MAG: class IV lanthionine synthetase LanL [Pseudonocardiaceae bacterium]